MNVNIHIDVFCPMCNSEIDLSYTKEEILTGKKLDFTCQRCGFNFKKELKTEMRQKTVEAVKNELKNSGFKVD